MKIIKRTAIKASSNKSRKSLANLLPTEPTQSRLDPAKLVLLLIATPKWGKTKFAMSNPKCLLLGFEEGHKFQRGFKMRMVAWDQQRGEYDAHIDDEGITNCTAMQALQALQDDKSDKFNMIAVDTVDMAAKMCADYFCDEGNVEHPSELGDYGKGWDKAINTPMRKFLLGILKTGRGLVLITHTKIAIEKFTSGEKARKEMTLGKGVRSLCESQADVIMHGELGRRRGDNRLRDRVFVCEGDQDTLAGNRSGAMLPARYIVSPSNPWKQFCNFFSDSKAADKAEEFEKQMRSSGVKKA